MAKVYLTLRKTAYVSPTIWDSKKFSHRIITLYCLLRIKRILISFLMWQIRKLNPEDGKYLGQSCAAHFNCA